ncbi:TPA: hypothetical protein ACJFNR_003387 [Escherichia coli]
MNKYLLCALLAISSNPASAYIYDLESGTQTINDSFAGLSFTVDLDSYGTAETYKPTIYNYNNPINFTWEWGTYVDQEGYQIDPGAITFRTAIANMFAFEKYDDSTSGEVDMGSYTFPNTPTQTEYSCEIPQTINSDKLELGRVRLTAHSIVRGSVPNGSKTISVFCSGNYILRKHLELTLADNEITLAGTQPTQLTGSTTMALRGFGGPVIVNIVNPHETAVSVSFEKDRDVTSTSMEPTSTWVPLEQQIYVRAKITNPGSYKYNVSLVASFK